jgi:20S proteasome alpha/beta subunit
VTVIVGIRCADGIVIGTDSAATSGDHSGAMLSYNPTAKIHNVSGYLVAGTGSVGLGQRFRASLAHLLNNGQLKGKDEGFCANTVAAAAIANYRTTHLQKLNFGALVAFRANGGLHLCEFEVGSLQPEFKQDLFFAAMGGGMNIADPFLGLMREVFWSDGTTPTLQEGIFAATWALRQSITLCPSGVNGPIQMASLTKKGITIYERAEIAEHEQNVLGALDHLRSYRDVLLGNMTTTPDIPKPEQK